MVVDLSCGLTINNRKDEFPQFRSTTTIRIYEYNKVPVFSAVILAWFVAFLNGKLLIFDPFLLNNLLNRGQKQLNEWVLSSINTSEIIICNSLWSTLYWPQCVFDFN